ncbi:MAG TPA: CHAD domain-containing protein, partial [Gaiellaceae bacterium]|nr:CHAD domain-containing protein [Gaiellaceae bacterium]
LLEHLRADIAAAGIDETGVRSLLDALEREHEVARAVAMEALSDARYFALLEQLERAEPKPAPGVSATLAELWWAELGRTRKRFEKLGASTPDDVLHAARIQVKRARYAAELASPELGKPGRRFVAAAKELQDVLGEHQDACVAEERIRSWAERDPAVGPVAARLLERERERRVLARREWPEAWRELDRRGERARP